MAIDTTDVVAPVFTATEVVVLLSARVTAQTGFRNFFWRLVLERNDLRGIAFCNVGLAWSMARLAARRFLFPTAKLYELSMRSMRKGFELIFVAVFTCFTADVVFSPG